MPISKVRKISKVVLTSKDLKHFEAFQMKIGFEESILFRERSRSGFNIVDKNAQSLPYLPQH